MRNLYLFNLKSFTLIAAIWLIPLTACAQNEPPVSNQRDSSSVLERILSLFKSRQNSLITRGDVCFVSPGNLGEQVIWSDRPIFIMEGQIPQAKIEIHSPETNYNYEQDKQVVIIGSGGYSEAGLTQGADNFPPPSAIAMKLGIAINRVT